MEPSLFNVISSTDITVGVILGLLAFLALTCVVSGFFTVAQNERAVKTSFGRAERVGSATTLDDPIAQHLTVEERDRYTYPQVRVIPPGGPYFKWPWEKVYKVSVATETLKLGADDYITKPFTIDYLLFSIKRVMGR